MALILAIDFDETLMNPNNVPKGYRMGQPEPGAIATVQRLHMEGHQIVIFTARNVQDPRAKKAVADWLDYFHIPYHDITNVKRADFDVMIDNRALHYQSWPQVSQDLNKLEQHWGVWSNHIPMNNGLIDDITKPILDN